jgi:two-component system OmpR family sensor kinase
MGLTLERSWKDLDDETRTEFLRSINDRAGALAALVEQLLDLSDLETARARLNTEPVDITELLSVGADRFANEHRRHRLDRAIQPGLCAMGDAALIARVVDQLLSNAGKHTPGGTTVTLSASGDGDVVTIDVADTGPGLASDDVELAAEAFHRGGDLNTRAPGLGLGLALAEEILMLHGSHLDVESEPGAGARFRFVLPCA